MKGGVSKSMSATHRGIRSDLPYLSLRSSYLMEPVSLRSIILSKSYFFIKRVGVGFSVDGIWGSPPFPSLEVQFKGVAVLEVARSVCKGDREDDGLALCQIGVFPSVAYVKVSGALSSLYF